MRGWWMGGVGVCKASTGPAAHVRARASYSQQCVVAAFRPSDRTVGRPHKFLRQSTITGLAQPEERRWNGATLIEERR